MTKDNKNIFLDKTLSKSTSETTEWENESGSNEDEDEFIGFGKSWSDSDSYCSSVSSEQLSLPDSPELEDDTNSKYILVTCSVCIILMNTPNQWPACGAAFINTQPIVRCKIINISSQSRAGCSASLTTFTNNNYKIKLVLVRLKFHELLTT